MDRYEYVCRKLAGKPLPKSCHVLNGRKQSCESLVRVEVDDKGSLIDLGL